METEGSAASIFAIRDWLERSRLATCVCESPRRLRSFRSSLLSDTFSSINPSSASERPRKSRVDPTFHPAAANRSLFALRIVGNPRRCAVIPAKPAAARFDHRCRSPAGFLCKYLGDHDCIWIKAIDEPELGAAIRDPKLMTSWTDGWHRSGSRHRESFSFLKHPQRIPHFNPPLLRERRRFYLSVKPDEGLISHPQDMSDPTLLQVALRYHLNTWIRTPSDS